MQAKLEQPGEIYTVRRTIANYAQIWKSGLTPKQMKVLLWGRSSKDEIVLLIKKIAEMLNIMRGLEMIHREKAEGLTTRGHGFIISRSKKLKGYFSQVQYVPGHMGCRTAQSA